MAQDDIVGEKQSGITAWILSKPVSRKAYVLAKLLANATGMLVVMVLAQGAVAYALILAATGTRLALGGFAASLGILFLNLCFYLTLATMIGAFAGSRAPVMGIPMLVLFSHNLASMLPVLRKIMPWGLVMPQTPLPSLAEALALGLPLPSAAPAVSAVIAVVVFITTALWRMQREDL